MIARFAHVFVGNYTPHEWNPADEYYYGVKSNNIIQAKESTAALKGMRGYFVPSARLQGKDLYWR